MIAMLLHAANSALSAFATFTESRALLLTSMVFRVLIWIVTLVGAVIICLYGVEESTLLVNELDEVFMGLIYKWNTDPRASRVLTMIQEYVGCCGAGGNRLDYINNRQPMPDSCRHPVTGNCFGVTCSQSLAWWLEPWTSTLAGTSVVFCAMDVAVIWVSARMRMFIGLTKEN